MRTKRIFIDYTVHKNQTSEENTGILRMCNFFYNLTNQSWRIFFHFSTVLYILQIPKVCNSYEGVTDVSSAVLILWENILMMLSVFILQSPPKTISKTHLLKDVIKIFASVIRDGPMKVSSLTRCLKRQMSDEYFGAHSPVFEINTTKFALMLNFIGWKSWQQFKIELLFIELSWRSWRLSL